MREPVPEKAARYLREHRLRIWVLTPAGRVWATCQGTAPEPYELGRTVAGTWWCRCPASRRCSHIAAAEMVVGALESPTRRESGSVIGAV